MREIKFRLILEGKIVGYEKWYPGCHSYIDGDHPEKGRYWRAKPCWLYSKDGEKWNPEPIFHSQKDLFTGLKEIYEGDIVKDILYGMGIIKIGEYENMDGEYYPKIYGPFVQFREKNCADDTQQQGLLQRHEEEEVIGNIHENPELLKDEK
jgi:hypothetical protein